MQRAIEYYLERLEGVHTGEDVKRLVRSKDREELNLGVFVVGYGAGVEARLRTFYLLVGRGEEDLPTAYVSPARTSFLRRRLVPRRVGDVRIRLRDGEAFKANFDLKSVSTYMGWGLPAPTHTNKRRFGRVGMVYDDEAVRMMDRALQQACILEEPFSLYD